MAQKEVANIKAPRKYATLIFYNNYIYYKITFSIS